MTKRIRNKVKAGDIIDVKKKDWYFVGRGTKMDKAKVLEVITEENDKLEIGGSYPLFRVETKECEVFTHKFFTTIHKEK